MPLAEGALRVRVLGAGPSLLLLHGLSAHGDVWRRVAAALCGRFRVLVPDLLGRGASEAPAGVAYGLADELRRVRELLAFLGETPPLVAGHSQGAALALALARAEAGVDGLALVNPVTPWTRRPRVLAALRPRLIRRVVSGIFQPLRVPVARAVLGRAYGPGLEVGAEDVARYAGPYADRARTEALLRALADWRPRELAGHLPERAPAARVLVGAHDPRIGEEEAARLARRLGVRLEVVAGAGHALPEEAPERVVRAVLELEEELGGARTPSGRGPRETRERGPDPST